MSKTAALDETIEMLNKQLAKAKLLKDRMAISDRLIRCHSLKLKYDDAGKGGKFSTPVPVNGATEDVGNSATN